MIIKLILFAILAALFFSVIALEYYYGRIECILNNKDYEGFFIEVVVKLAINGGISLGFAPISLHSKNELAGIGLVFRKKRIFVVVLFWSLIVLFVLILVFFGEKSGDYGYRIR